MKSKVFSVGQMVRFLIGKKRTRTGEVVKVEPKGVEVSFDTKTIRKNGVRVVEITTETRRVPADKVVEILPRNNETHEALKNSLNR